MTNGTAKEPPHTALRNSLELVSATGGEDPGMLVGRLRDALARFLPVVEAHAARLDRGTTEWDRTKAGIDQARRALADTGATDGRAGSAGYQLCLLVHVGRMLLRFRGATGGE